MNRSRIQPIRCFLALVFILSAAAIWGMAPQEKDEKYLQYRDKLDKLKTLGVAKMRTVRDRTNEKFLGISKELAKMPPEEVGKWLSEHESEEAQAKQIQNESARQRETIYKEYTAERERLESVYKAGGLGKVGYVFIGDVEYNSSRRPLEAWHAGLKNLVTFGWVTGNEPSKLEDFEPLIHKKEEMMGKKFETAITVYLARGEDLTKALGDPKTAGYVWISHGGRDKREVYDDNGDPVSAGTLTPLWIAAQDRYIKQNLPEELAKIYAEAQSPVEDVKERAIAKLDALSGDDRELYDYLRQESLKVNLGLDYAEHFACLSGAEGAQKLVNMLMGKNGVFIGYKGVMDHTGDSGRITFRGLTSSPTMFKSENSPDPDPQETMRKKAGTWVLNDQWTSTYSTNLPAVFGSVAFPGDVAILTSTSGKTSHTLPVPPASLKPGDSISLKLVINRQEGKIGRAYTLVFYGNYSSNQTERRGVYGGGARIPSLMDWAGTQPDYGQQPDQGPLFEGRPVKFSLLKKGEEIVIDAALQGKLFLTGEGGETTTVWTGKAPQPGEDKIFLLIISSGHAIRGQIKDTGDTAEGTLSVSGARYYEYIWKGKEKEKEKKK